MYNIMDDTQAASLDIKNCLGSINHGSIDLTTGLQLVTHENILLA